VDARRRLADVRRWRGWIQLPPPPPQLLPSPSAQSDRPAMAALAAGGAGAGAGGVGAAGGHTHNAFYLVDVLTLGDTVTCITCAGERGRKMRSLGGVAARVNG
jgi:hypothetical protein